MVEVAFSAGAEEEECFGELLCTKIKIRSGDILLGAEHDMTQIRVRELHWNGRNNKVARRPENESSLLFVVSLGKKSGTEEHSSGR